MDYSRDMIKLNIHEIKSQLSKYIDLVEAGETVVVCKRNVPVAEIRPLEQKSTRRPKLGWAEGQTAVTAVFSETMPEDELKLWEGGDDDPLLKYAPKKKSRK
jgi:prevent-host-death family protein